MFKRASRIIVLLVLCAAAAARQPGSGSTAADRGKAVYRIYSQMLTSCKPPQLHFSISPTTRPLSMMDPARCIMPPQNRQPEFNEVLADFEARRNTPRTLKREFSLSVPFDLFTRSEAVDWTSQHPKYVFTLTDVYFSSGGKLALTGFDAYCGSLCGVFMWKVFEKTASGEWQPRNRVNCFGAS